ncbi:hypothetical protein ACQCVK_21905 [Rossellomorea vietnamensis]|uniref:hypothetical protein n=1 Tax=Rossellomorea vietnamensis TaxID=218284 RepID=UPI003CE6C4A4
MNRLNMVGAKKISQDNSYKTGKPVQGTKAVVSSKKGDREETGVIVYKRKVEYKERA